MITSMNTGDMGTRYMSATARRTLLALMSLCFGERFGMVTMVTASGEVRKTSSASTAAHATMHSEQWIFTRQFTVGGSSFM